MTTHHSTTIHLNGEQKPGVLRSLFLWRGASPQPRSDVLLRSMRQEALPASEDHAPGKEIPQVSVARVGVVHPHHADDHGNERTHREDYARGDANADRQFTSAHSSDRTF